MAPEAYQLEQAGQVLNGFESKESIKAMDNIEFREPKIWGQTAWVLTSGLRVLGAWISYLSSLTLTFLIQKP